MNSSVKPVAMAVGAAVAGSLMLTQAASAAGNPFSLSELQAGYMQPVCSAERKGAEGKCGAGKCGAEMNKDRAGKCGAGKCGGDADKRSGAGKCGAT